MTKRGKLWGVFATTVLRHIETYTVPQYGDAGEDIASNYTVEHCVEQMKKYLARAGRNARPGQQQLDFIKIAHYAQMAHDVAERTN